MAHRGAPWGAVGPKTKRPGEPFGREGIDVSVRAARAIGVEGHILGGLPVRAMVGVGGRANGAGIIFFQ